MMERLEQSRIETSRVHAKAKIGAELPSYSPRCLTSPYKCGSSTKSLPGLHEKSRQTTSDPPLKRYI